MFEYFGYIALGVLGTVGVTFGALAIGTVVGMPLAWLRRSRHAIVRMPAVAVIEVLRGVPNLVWLFLVFFGLPQIGIRLDPWSSAILTLGVASAAHIAEIYRGGLAGLSRGQWEASDALGLSRMDRRRLIVLPQMQRVIVPTMATYAIGLLKDSALASTIGVVELTFRGGVVTQRTGDGLTTFLVVGVVYLLLSLPLALAARRVDSRMRAKFSVG
ncbi:MAG TPA: amino acid ABC transporter permease [Pseudolysinimonas sp.]|nr:amino acid ABC transporter permease [Pseudolysinimonas sp.]